ncbi:hypothetical protein M9434_000118 [Picochlorum sp. BPE23]|nr:hypothetical protein M9434_000118 [Picochlorum sp. BPE23]
MAGFPLGSIVENLPDDILFNHVLRYCSVRDVVSLGRASKAQYRRLLCEDGVWQALASSWYPEACLHVKTEQDSCIPDVEEGGGLFHPGVVELEEDVEEQGNEGSSYYYRRQEMRQDDSFQENTTQMAIMPYDGYKDVVADDGARYCKVVWMDIRSPVLLLSVSRHATPDQWCTCEVNIIDVSRGISRRSGRTVRVYITISSKGIHDTAMEESVSQSCIALAKRSGRNPRRYGDIVQKLYREGLYPPFCHDAPNNLIRNDDTRVDNIAKRNEIATCDRLARHALDFPEHMPQDIFKILTPRFHMMAGSPGRPGGFAAWYDFLLDDMLDQTMEAPYDILFTFGHSHPYLPTDGEYGNHPIILTPLQEFVESGCHSRARSMRYGAWLPINSPRPSQ